MADWVKQAAELPGFSGLDPNQATCPDVARPGCDAVHPRDR